MQKQISPYSFPGIPISNENLENLLENVSSFYQVPVEKIKSKTRFRDVTDARQVFMLTAKKYTRHSLGSIGNIVNRDHATVLHAYRNYDRDYTLKVKADDFLKKFGYIQ